MTHNNDSNLLAEAMEHVIENGLDGLSDTVALLLNETRLIDSPHPTRCFSHLLVAPAIENQ